MHGLALAAQDKVRAARQFVVLLVAGDDPLHGVGHGPQVGPIHIRIDIDDRLDVVVAHRAQLGSRRDGGQVAQHLDRRLSARRAGSGRAAGRSSHGGAGDRQAFQSGQRVDPILRRLNGHVVGDSALGIEIEGGGGLEAAAQSHQQAGGHIFLSQADGLGTGAVHVHRHFGIVEWLLNARVGGAGNIPDLIKYALGEGAVAIEVWADDLDIDGRGQTEVQNLRHNVHRQHIKRHAGILADQHGAQALDVGRGGMVVLAQLHLDVGVGRADGRRGRVGQVQSRVGQPNVIDDRDHFAGRNILADGGVDVIAEQSRLLDSRPGAGTHVNLELPGVHRGEEILAEPGRKKTHRCQCKYREQDQKEPRVVHAHGEQAQVSVASLFEAGLEGQLKAGEWVAARVLPYGLRVVVLPQQVLGHGGHQRAGEQIAGQHGKNHRLRHGYEKVLRHPAEQEHGHKDDADGDGRDKGGNGNLRRAVQDGLLQFPARLQVAVDVLDGHRGIVHQDADGKRHAAQGHDVDGLVQR